MLGELLLSTPKILPVAGPLPTVPVLGTRQSGPGHPGDGPRRDDRRHHRRGQQPAAAGRASAPAPVQRPEQQRGGAQRAVRAGLREGEADRVREGCAVVHPDVAVAEVSPVRWLVRGGIGGTGVHAPAHAVLIGEVRLSRQPQVGRARIGAGAVALDSVVVAAIRHRAAVDRDDVTAPELDDLHLIPVRIAVALDPPRGIPRGGVVDGPVGDGVGDGVAEDPPGEKLASFPHLDFGPAQPDGSVVAEVLIAEFESNHGVVELACRVDHPATAVSDEAERGKRRIVGRIGGVLVIGDPVLIDAAAGLRPAIEAGPVEDDLGSFRVYWRLVRHLHRTGAVEVHVADVDRCRSGDHGQIQLRSSRRHLVRDRPRLQLPAVGPAEVGLVAVVDVIRDVDWPENRRGVGPSCSQLDPARGEVRLRSADAHPYATPSRCG